MILNQVILKNFPINSMQLLEKIDEFSDVISLTIQALPGVWKIATAKIFPLNMKIFHASI